MTVIGITATRHGLTTRQALALTRWFLPGVEVHHGDCVGGDHTAHQLALENGCRVVIHPPEDPRHRAWCRLGPNDEVLPKKPYLKRNADIIAAADFVLACPRESEEPPPRRGQGTWSTVRRARKAGVPVIILWP